MAESTPSERQATSVGLARLSSSSANVLGWPHVIIGRERDRPLARFVVGASGLILGASTGMFVGGMLGVILAMALLPLLPEIAVGLLVVTTITCGSAGAVVGSRVLQRETFDEVP
ncbi:MAG TPA: hypothetical protein VM869_30235 [Enhygromyxa sp.]|nr:hypothetical protein [Enhygromyxa sp.]